MLANHLNFQGQPVKSTIHLLDVPLDSLGLKQLLKPSSSFAGKKWYISTEDNMPLISQRLTSVLEILQLDSKKLMRKQVICVLGAVFNQGW